MGMYAEAAQLCAMVQDDNYLCIQALQQATDSQNPEVSIRSEQSLTSKSHTASGESSLEHTPPQMFTGVSPASLKVLFATHIFLVPLLILRSGNPVVGNLKVIANHRGLHRPLFNGNSPR